ncbi:MAG: OmpA family protein [Saprospiraceae bacterium]|nr:OmpA family protein [Saprospiraceae bacterium]
MTKKVALFTVIFFGIVFGHAQESSPDITDEMTIDADQNSKWRQGQYPYAAKPKSMWELGVHAGYSFISGDVEAPVWAGAGLGLHLRKAINYTLSVRFNGWFTRSKGFDARSLNPATLRSERLYRFRENNAIEGYVNNRAPVHRNYQTSILGGSAEAVLNIGNMLFHAERTDWNVYAVAGIGLNIPTTKVDLLNGSVLYNFESVAQGLDLTTRDGRKESRKRLKDLLDGDYETDGGVANDVIALGDKKSVLPHLNFGLGVSRRINERINIGLEYQVLVSDSDLYDGFEFRTPQDESTNLDIPHYFSIRVGINLGDFSKRTEPLYWLNPLSGPLGDLAEVKARPILDLTDTDGDGIIDMLDQEVASPDGAPVDTRGIVLDSDADGVADYEDAEPYSVAGYEVDSRGVAQVPDPGYLNEDDVNEIVNQKISNIRTDWFLPMVHFDLDKYYVKPEFYGQLHQIATVLKQHPNINLVARGYADARNPDEYNDVLSYKRADAAVSFLMDRYDLPRQRFLIQYAGEDNPLIPDLPESHAIDKRLEMQQYLNRRVEFQIANPDDREMDLPEGIDPEKIGSGTPGSSRPGTKYSGNRNSGY